MENTKILQIIITKIMSQMQANYLEIFLTNQTKIGLGSNFKVCELI